MTVRESMEGYYVISPNDSELKTVIFEIAKGKFEGVRFSYGSVSFREENGIPRLKFSYDINEIPNSKLDLDGQDKVEFETMLGDILVHIQLSESKTTMEE